VIVRFRAGASGIDAAVAAVGGRIVRYYETLNAVQAVMDGEAAAALGRDPQVVAVTPDASIDLADDDDDDDDDDEDEDDSFGWQPDSASAPSTNVADVTQALGISNLLSTLFGSNSRLGGQGVGVALIDSGVVPLPGFDASRVVNGPDLSFESQSENLRYLDTYGHGTHMAGIIVGRDPAGGTDRKKFIGMAPDATLLSMKVASTDGATDVSQVIAAIDWVVQHKNDPGLNIRVLNLSFGTTALQPAAVDPLAYAAEVAWRNGIVVVVAAGNDGNATSSLTNPAIDPFVIAVGAVDNNGTRDDDDDRIASFSNRGSMHRPPDIIAPGRSVVSLRNPGSYIDTNHPEGRIAGNDAVFKGSGTSQSAAVVSGAVALLLQQRPNLTPNQVKYILKDSADDLRNVSRRLQGEGQLDLEDALDTSTPSGSRAAQWYPYGTGLGSLEGARGDSHVMDATTGDVLEGEIDIFGTAWDPATWAPDALAGRSWRGHTWRNNTWTGSDWTGSSWTGRTWRSAEWTASSWRGHTWRDATWTNAAWDGHTWRNLDWTGHTWRGHTWRGHTWRSIEG
jgi:serine protease AprX